MNTYTHLFSPSLVSWFHFISVVCSAKFAQYFCKGNDPTVTLLAWSLFDETPGVVVLWSERVCVIKSTLAAPDPHSAAQIVVSAFVPWSIHTIFVLQNGLSCYLLPIFKKKGVMVSWCTRQRYMIAPHIDIQTGPESFLHMCTDNLFNKNTLLLQLVTKPVLNVYL